MITLVLYVSAISCHFDISPNPPFYIPSPKAAGTRRGAAAAVAPLVLAKLSICLRFTIVLPFYWRFGALPSLT